MEILASSPLCTTGSGTDNPGGEVDEVGEGDEVGEVDEVGEGDEVGEVGEMDG